jgi:hypothetical protein
VSEFYQLGMSQDELDFVDVDLIGDDPLFVDPFLLRTEQNEWAQECVLLVQDFFVNLLSALRDGPQARVEQLLRELGEPNETHLGYSGYIAQGRGLGQGLGAQVGDALAKSRALESGVLQDLEDTVLMVPGIGRDMISDLTTNVIRGPLVEYTQDVAAAHAIELSPTAARVWDRVEHRWDTVRAEVPRPDAGRGPRPLLLVPKSIVRVELTFKSSEYYRYFMLDFLAGLELNANSELVRLLKDGTPKVTKRDLIRKYGSGKDAVASLTARFPEVLDKYRERKRSVPPRPATPQQVSLALGLAGPDFDALLAAVVACNPGPADATTYHRAVMALLTAIFRPELVLPVIELEVNAGRKRIDIAYTNVASAGFFHWLVFQQGVHAPNVLAECKNYTREIANPELDQLAGRLDPYRGTFGVLVCRSIGDRAAFNASCRDRVRNDMWMVGMDDVDLQRLVVARKSVDPLDLFQVMKALFDPLVM